MSPSGENSRWSRQVVYADTVHILENLTADWEMDFQGPIGAETRLVADLGCYSVDVVQLAIAIEEHFQRRSLPFHKLLMTADGRYVEDVTVQELVDFLHACLGENGSKQTSRAPADYPVELNAER